MSLAALVAAAGASARMGFSKLLLAPKGGLPLVVTTCRAFRDGGVDRVFVTLPPLDQRNPADVDALLQVEALLRADGVSTAENRFWEHGLIGSVWSVLDENPDLDELFLTPVDVPGIDAALVRALATHAGGGAWAAPLVQDTHGHPVMIPRALLPAVRAYAGAGGVQAVLQHQPSVTVHQRSLSVVTSVDTPEQAARAHPPLVRWG